MGTNNQDVEMARRVDRDVHIIMGTPSNRGWGSAMHGWCHASCTWRVTVQNIFVYLYNSLL
jgi:hypothetical protein